MKTLVQLMLLSLLATTAFAASNVPGEKHAPKYAEKHDNKGIEDATYCEARVAAEKVAKNLSKYSKGETIQ